MTADIAAVCSAVADAAVEAQGWLEHEANADLVGAERKPVRRELRRGAFRARKLALAAERPMCVSVFGPSQAGKSFLVSVLARPDGGRLVADYPDPAGRLDFITQINPEGEGESTGIVTRFTIRRYDAPAGFPVKLKLLAEGDIARILANTFLMDGDKSEPEPTGEEFDDLFRRLSARAGGAQAGGLSSEDMMETQEYLEKGFRKSAYVAALAGFWDEAIDLAPRLPVAERAQLLSVLWGRHEPFTRLYERLARGLEALGGAEVAFTGLDALVPREKSIIDVKLLAGLDRDGGPTLTLVSPNGRRATLPKPVVTALTAELVLPMAETPYPLFEGTDLLDFPGARTRFEKPLAKFLSEGAGPLKECVLRGKVAYLFDRYVAEQEITAMLLCIADSNMEVADLPKLVDDWISNTHGASAAARAGADTLLFFVLTKFDKHLIDSAASSDDPRTRFERRMQASLLEKFAAMSESWPVNWSDGRPFDNCYWLRNPNYPAEAVIQYDAQKREIDYLPQKLSRIAELRAGCIGADLVRRHFRDPEAAWDAAMALNDGGVSYLINSLTPVCRPEIKRRQVGAQIRETAKRLLAAVSRFHVSDDLAERLEKKRADAQALMGELLRVYEHRMFGALIGALAVHPDGLADAMRRTPGNIRIVARSAARPTTTETTGTLRFGPSGGIVLPGGPRPGPSGIVLPGGAAPAPAPAGRGADADRIRTMTRGEWRAEVAYGLWVSRLRGFASSPEEQARFGIGTKAVSDLASELIDAAKRMSLQRRLADRLDAAVALERGEAGAVSAAILAAEELNGFTALATAGLAPPAARPDIPTGDGVRKPFAPRPQADGLDGLGELPRRADEDYVTSWMHMVYRVFEDNATQSGEGGGSVDPAQNARLGAVLKAFAAA